MKGSRDEIPSEFRVDLMTTTTTTTYILTERILFGLRDP